MPDYSYRAKTSTGAVSEGILTAGSPREAMTQLTRRSLFPLEVRDQADTKGPFSFKLELSSRIKTETIADTLTGLSDLLGNGVALLESLTILSEQATDKKMGAPPARERGRRVPSLPLAG